MCPIPVPFIIGGGASNKLGKCKNQLIIEVPLLIAENRNEAGIVDAAMYAAENLAN